MPVGAPTHQVLTKPEPGTVISPVYQYTDEQQAQIDALREVGTYHPSLVCLHLTNPSLHSTHTASSSHPLIPTTHGKSAGSRDQIQFLVICVLRNGICPTQRNVLRPPLSGEGNINLISSLLMKSKSKARPAKCASSSIITLLDYVLIITYSIITGFDRDGRPIIYMRPGRENTETSPRQLRHLVWCL